MRVRCAANFAMASPRILVVDADTAQAEKVGLALIGAGFDVAVCSFSPSEVTNTIKELPPQLLLVHAELGSPQLTTLLARLDGAGQAQLPMVLLCRDTSEDVFVRPLRTGVVELLEEPFNARPHVGRIRVLLGELGERSGQLRGRGGPNELSAFVHHVMRTRRTGGLEVGHAGEGRASFVRGVLKGARLGMHIDQPALAAMTRLQAPWVFTEGAAVAAAGADEPLSGVFPASRPSSVRAAQAEPAAPAFRSTGSFVAAPPRAGSPSAVAPLGSMGSGLRPPPSSGSAVRAPVQGSPSSVFEPRAPPAAPGLPPTTTAGSQPDLPVVVDALADAATMLFVDDEPAVLQMLASYFSKKGHPVETAADGVEAMAKLVAKPFEVVVADLNMPRLDGWGLLRLIREDVRTRELQVALFSAQDNYRESLRLLQAGAQAYFPKALRLSALDFQLRELREPRNRFLRLVEADVGMTFDIGALGPQWVLRTLSRTGFSGQLDAGDPWATWRLGFDHGRLAQVSARIGATVLSGERALAGFLLSRKAEGSLSRQGGPTDEHFLREPTDVMLARLVPWLNDEQRRAREGELAKAKALVVHEELYRLYVTVGPPAWLPIARLLCELKLTPAEVIARLQVTTNEVAVVVNDLLTRGVVTLQS